MTSENELSWNFWESVHKLLNAMLKTTAQINFHF